MASKKLKKALKALGAGIAIAGLGKAFANRNKTSAADVDSGRGGDSSSAMARKIANTVAKKSVYPDAIMRGGKGAVIPDNLPITSANVQRGLVEAPLSLRRIRSMDQTGTAGDIAGEAAMFKKGGRVGCGVAKKGFGKAMKRRKK